MGINDGQACKNTWMGAATVPANIQSCVASGYAMLNSLKRDAFVFSASPTGFAGGVFQSW
jgi:hypothetical protein